MRIFLLILLLAKPLFTIAQSQTTTAIIRDFIIEGNHKTKHSLITRELTVHVGDTIPLSELAAKLEENRLRLLGTNLFNDVKINVKNWSSDDKVSIAINVTERWYLYPIPIFELADRNLNVWWKEQHHDLRRLNYGIRFVHNNITGRRDPFSMLVQYGYTPKYAISYNLPYLNKKQTIGATIDFLYATNRELGYATLDNRVVFHKGINSNIFTRYGYSGGIIYSPGLYQKHVWSAGYSHQKVDTSISENLNPNYFIESQSSQSYFWLNYDYTHDIRDYKPFPMKGHIINISVSKSGLFKNDDVRALDVRFRWSQYFKLNPKTSIESIVRLKSTLSKQPLPYNFQRAIGYSGDYMRGYELFVIDGYDFGIIKNSIRYQILDKEYDFTRFCRYKLLQSLFSLPIKVYVSTNFDLGYSYTPQYNPVNNFSNRLLYGGGIGLNVLMYHGIFCQFEYSVNHLGQDGFYVHYKTSF